MKWALVLSGGGAKGFVYIGMLQAFRELHLPSPDLVVGCSIGAIAGSMIALGKSIEEIEAFFNEDFDAEDYLGGGYVLPIKSVNRVLSVGTMFSNLIAGNSMDDGKKVYHMLKKITSGKNFSDTKIPFVCNAVNLHSGCEVTLYEGELAKAVLASASYPVAFPPVRIGNMLLVDGGIGHNTPVCIARKLGFDEVFAVTLDHFRQTSFPEKYSNPIALMNRAILTIFENRALQQDDYPSFWLDLSNEVHSADFSQGVQQIRFGYLETIKHKKDIQAFFADNAEGEAARKKMRAKIQQNYRL